VKTLEFHFEILDNPRYPYRQVRMNPGEKYSLSEMNVVSTCRKCSELILAILLLSSGQKMSIMAVIKYLNVCAVYSMFLSVNDSEL